MIKLESLKKGDKFYIVDTDFNVYDEDAVIECEVVRKYVKVGKYITIKTLNCMYVDGDTSTNVLPIESIESKFYKELEDCIFNTEELDNAIEYLEEYEEENGFDYHSNNYIPPEEYPDWDGDESIMYYIEHYDESDDEDEDEDEDEDNFDDDEDEYICEACGNCIVIEGNIGCFTCPECGTEQNI